MHASLRQKVDELRETARVKTPYAPIPSKEKNPRESNFGAPDPKLDVVWNAMFGVEVSMLNFSYLFSRKTSSLGKSL